MAALRAISRAPVAYAELPLAQHAFDVLASLRFQATTNGVAAFLDAARSAAQSAAHSSGHPSGPSTAASGVSDIVSETSA